MTRTRKTIFQLSVMIVAALAPFQAMALTELADDQLSKITGQAVMMMEKNDTWGAASNLTFYKAGLDAVMEINTNIEKLQLGCGGVNGPGCDIDIDNMSLSGPDTCAGGRVNCSAILTRPFFEFAIRNDDSKTLREIVGIRMSAENAQGQMTFGDQTAAMTDAEARNGINSLSGYMQLGVATGTANTAARYMCYTTAQCSVANGGDGSTGLSQGSVNGVPIGTDAHMTGRLYANLGILGADSSDFYSDVYQLSLGTAPADITTTPKTIFGNRMTSVNLTGSATVDDVNFTGTMQANADILGGISLEKTVSGTIRGLTASVDITQSLAFIHKIDVNNPFSLSMQRTDVLWPGAALAAQTGWWLAFEDEISIGDISPEADVALTNEVLMQALTGDDASGDNTYDTNNTAGANNYTCAVPSINCALYRGHSWHTDDGSASTGIHGVDCFSTAECLSGTLPVPLLTVPVDLYLPLTDLKLGAQGVTPNCWGSARFC